MTLEFAPGDLATVEPRALPRWLAVSGSHAAGPPGDGQGQGLGRRPPDHRPRGGCRAGRAGARARRHGRPRRTRARAPGPAAVGEGAVRDGRKDHGDEQAVAASRISSPRTLPTTRSRRSRSRRATCRPPKRRSSCPECAARRRSQRRRSSGIVAKRHVQPGEKVAFDSPLVTVVDLKEMELQALVPVGRHPRAQARHDGRPRRRRFRPIASSPGASNASTRRPRRERARSWSTSASRTRRWRCAAACSPPAASRWRPARRWPRCRRRPCAPKPARSYVWTIEDGKLAQAASSSSAAATRRRARRDQDGAAGRHAGAGRALRQPEGRRARAGARSRRARPAEDQAELGRHVDHPRIDQQPRLRDDGDGRHRRARPVRLQPAARRADAGR